MRKKSRSRKYEKSDKGRLRNWKFMGIKDPEVALALFYTVKECQACGWEGEYGRAGLHIDHDHETGLTRGVLCQRCNMALGLLGDEEKRINRLATYLRQRAGEGNE